MKCKNSHQQAYAKGNRLHYPLVLWCPDCQRMLNESESHNVFLRLLRKLSNIPDSLEQQKLEGGGNA